MANKKCLYPKVRNPKVDTYYKNSEGKIFKWVESIEKDSFKKGHWVQCCADSLKNSKLSPHYQCPACKKVLLPNYTLDVLEVEKAKELLGAILVRACYDAAYQYQWIRKKNKFEWVRDETAIQWFFSKRKEINSFLGICNALGLDPEAILSKIKSLTLAYCQSNPEPFGPDWMVAA